MATYPNAVLTARANSTVDLIDAGSTNPGGAVLIYTSGFATLLVQFDLSKPAYDAAANGVAQLRNTPITATAVAGGTAADYRVVDRDGNIVWSGSGQVGTSGTELVISSTTIVNGNDYELASLTHNETQGA